MTKKFEFLDVDGRRKEAELFLASEFVTHGSPNSPLKLTSAGTLHESLLASSGAVQSQIDAINIQILALSNQISNIGAGGSGGSLLPTRESITITPAHITNKKFALSQTAAIPTIFLIPAGGLPQRYGVDFQHSAVDNTIRWDNLSLEGFLAVGDEVEVYYFVEVPSTSVNGATQIFYLTNQNILDKKVTLSSVANSPSSVVLTPGGGPTQIYGVDFSVNGDEVFWGGLGLDGVLEVNDTIVIQY